MVGIKEKVFILLEGHGSQKRLAEAIGLFYLFLFQQGRSSQRFYLKAISYELNDVSFALKPMHMNTEWLKSG